jgi:hypothetical protein
MIKPIQTKKFTKMSAEEQEALLVERLQTLNQAIDETKRMLAAIRGGYKYEASTEVDRPDLLILKSGEGI